MEKLKGVRLTDDFKSDILDFTSDTAQPYDRAIAFEMLEQHASATNNPEEQVYFLRGAGEAWKSVAESQEKMGLSPIFLDFLSGIAMASSSAEGDRAVSAAAIAHYYDKLGQPEKSSYFWKAVAHSFMIMAGIEE